MICPYFRNVGQVAIDYLPPQAAAIVRGGPDVPLISGVVTFKDTPGGVIVCADFFGLPLYKPAQDGKPPVGPFGFHIHENGNCGAADPSDPFKDAGGHWNPYGQPHGNNIKWVSIDKL